LEEFEITFLNRQDKAALLEMRQIIKREMQANKASILERFDKIKKGRV